MSLFDRLRPRRAAPASTLLSTRSQIRPPETWGQAAPVWQRLQRWLTGQGAAGPSPDATREDFLAALDGLQGRSAHDLRLRAEHARSLRELWHLRAELYNLIARQLSQGEAERRLAPVNAHFAGPPATASRAPLPARRSRQTQF